MFYPPPKKGHCSIRHLSGNYHLPLTPRWTLRYRKVEPIRLFMTRALRCIHSAMRTAKKQSPREKCKER